MRDYHEVEFTIHADGTVEEKVLNVAGDACLDLTAEIEQALGEVVDRKPTQDMYQQPVDDAVTQQAWNTVADDDDAAEPDW